MQAVEMGQLVVLIWW